MSHCFFALIQALWSSDPSSPAPPQQVFLLKSELLWLRFTDFFFVFSLALGYCFIFYTEGLFFYDLQPVDLIYFHKFLSETVFHMVQIRTRLDLLISRRCLHLNAQMKWRLNLYSGSFVLKCYKSTTLGHFLSPPPNQNTSDSLVIWINLETQVKWVDLKAKGIKVFWSAGVCGATRPSVPPRPFHLVPCHVQVSFVLFYNSRVLQRGGDGFTQPRCGGSPLEDLCPLFTLHSSVVRLAWNSVQLWFVPSCADSFPPLLTCRVASSLSGTIA